MRQRHDLADFTFERCARVLIALTEAVDRLMDHVVETGVPEQRNEVVLGRELPRSVEHDQQQAANGTPLR